MSVDKIIERQDAIANGDFEKIGLPAFHVYSMCNLRGGIGKTTLAFNLSYLTDNLLAVDTCPQGNLSYFYDNNYFGSSQTNVYDILMPYLIPGLGKAGKVSSYIGATNPHFAQLHNYYIPSSAELYLMPSQLITAINQANGLLGIKREQALKTILFSLDSEIKREMEDNALDKCIIDTSPFFAGATQLSWYAAEALIIPVRTDQQSLNSLELLINTLTSPSGEFRRYLPPGETHTPKIQMVILTHCGWSTASGSKNEPNRQTRIYVNKVYDILSKHRNLLSTDNPENHLFLLDDFLGTGRVSSYESKPIELLQAGQTRTINRTKVAVSKSVEKCKNQLKFISNQLW